MCVYLCYYIFNLLFFLGIFAILINGIYLSEIGLTFWAFYISYTWEEKGVDLGYGRLLLWLLWICSLLVWLSLVLFD